MSEFKVYTITNTMGVVVLNSVELPNGLVEKRNCGNLPNILEMQDFVEQNFELFLDGETQGMYKLLTVKKHSFTYDKVGTDDN